MKFDLGQVPAVLRQGGQYAAGAVSLAVALGSIPADTAHMLISDIGDVVDGLSKATAGLGKIIVIVGPIVGAVIGKFAFTASGTKSAIDKTKAAAADTSTPMAEDASAALKSATSTLPNTVVVTTSPATDVQALATKIAAIPESHTVITTPEVAASTVSGKIVSQ